MMHTRTNGTTISLAIILGFVVTGFFATVATAGDDDAMLHEELVMVDSRYGLRTDFNSLVPSDVIDRKTLVGQFGNALPELIRGQVPSFNVNTQPISYGSTLIRPFNFRGLSSQHTLVLVNSRRRHRGAVISWYGPEASRGAQGPDISVIPTIALDRLEVLRDGNFVRYGSDAVAGVLNFVLRDGAKGLDVEATTGQYSEGDGLVIRAAGNLGLPLNLAGGGFVNLSIEASESEDTDRGVLRTDAVNDADTGQIWGNPQINQNVKSFYNAVLELNESLELYSFGNYAQRETSGTLYHRSPGSEDGGPYTTVGDRYANEEPLLFYLVGNTAGADSCPKRVELNDSDTLALIRSSANCFVANKIFPNGFTPVFGGDITDYSVHGGLRGKLDSDLSWDLSAGVGGSQVDFFIYNTLNPSLGTQSPVNFDAGSYTQIEQNLAIDISYPLRISWLPSGLLAAGIEWREENFEVDAGESSSWQRGSLADQGFLPRSHGFAGFPIEAAGTWVQDTLSLYADLEFDLNEIWSMAVGLRFANPSLVGGNTLNGRIGTRVRLVEGFAMRGTFSTGERTASPGQARATHESLEIVDHEETLVATVPAYIDSLAPYGGKNLEQESFTNIAAGFVLQRGRLAASLDCFVIDIRDRLALTNNIPMTGSLRADLMAEGFSSAVDWDYIRFFTHRMDTSTTGCDAAASYGLQWENGFTDLSIQWHNSSTNIQNVAVGDGLLDSESRMRDLRDGLPKERLALAAHHVQGPWDFTVRFNYHDSWYDSLQGLYFDGYGVVDVAASYRSPWGVTFTVGVDNVFDEYPGEIPNAGASGTGYSQNAPHGFNGLFGYFRAGYKLDLFGK